MAEITRSSTHIYSGKFLQVYRDETELPDGAPAIREWIKHPGAAAILALTDDHQLLMVRQYRYATRTEYLEIPAGKRDAGEDPLETAKRELEEETGYVAERWTYLAALHPCIGYSNEVIHYYLAEGLTRGKMAPDEGEWVELVLIPVAEAYRMAREGALPDSKTVSGLFLAESWWRTLPGM